MGFPRLVPWHCAGAMAIAAQRDFGWSCYFPDHCIVLYQVLQSTSVIPRGICRQAPSPSLYWARMNFLLIVGW